MCVCVYVCVCVCVYPHFSGKKSVVGCVFLFSPFSRHFVQTWNLPSCHSFLDPPEIRLLQPTSVFILRAHGLALVTLIVLKFRVRSPYAPKEGEEIQNEPVSVILLNSLINERMSKMLKLVQKRVCFVKTYIFFWTKIHLHCYREELFALLCVFTIYVLSLKSCKIA